MPATPNDPTSLEATQEISAAELPAANRARVETVSFETLTKDLPPPKPRTFLEWSGIRQMNILLLGICVMVGLFFLGWVFSRPGLDQAKDLVASARGTGGSAEVPVEEFAKVLENLKKDHYDSFRDMFQLVVVGALVPLFTLLAGYVFGRGQKPPAAGGDGAGR